MQINVAYNTNTNIPSRIVPPANNNQPTFRKAQNDNTVAINIPVNQQASVVEAQVLRHEINHLLQQFTEWTRVVSEAKRMELLYNLLLKSNHETSDLFGMIMEIARRIMAGESVTVEEMRFVFNHNPQLLFVLVLLIDQSAGNDDKERRRVRERRRKNRRSEASNQTYDWQSYKVANTNRVESAKLSTPRDTLEDKRSPIEMAAVTSLYHNVSNGKSNSTSIYEFRTSHYNIAV